MPIFAGQGMELRPIELFTSSSVYRWHGAQESLPLSRLGLPQVGGDDIPVAALPRLYSAVAGFKPDAIMINGWGLRHSLALHAWCKARGVARVLVSDSQAIDLPRRKLVEYGKSRIVAGCASAFVAGAPQRRYVEQLGLAADRIVEGCDVVDNSHFRPSPEARQWGRNVLTVARFEEGKNLMAAARAFTRFAQSRPGEAWRWTLVGYGALEAELAHLAMASGGAIRMLGFVDYVGLPGVYADASLYWQPSIREPWGLAVNEAMASGLPVLVSSQCGCREDLVTAENGWLCDPFSDDALVAGLQAAATQFSRWREMGAASAARIDRWDLERFADGALASVRVGLEFARGGEPAALRSGARGVSE